MSTSTDTPTPWHVTARYLAIPVLVLALLAYCGWKDHTTTMHYNARIPVLEQRSQEIGDSIQDTLSSLDLDRPPTWGLLLRNVDDIGDPEKDPLRSWIYTGRAELDPEGTTTPEDAALKITDQLLAEGWDLGDGGIQPGDIGLVRDDDLGSWTIIITYQTDPTPPLAQWVAYDVFSPTVGEK